MKSHSTIILLGGNKPETLDLFNDAEEIIGNSFGKIINHSSIYKSAPWGFVADSDFFNKVIEVETFLKPEEQISKLLSIEKHLGREPKVSSGYESRCIDLDILFIDDLEIQTPELVVPHPQLHKRKFTLVPLNEKWHYKIHPTLKKTVHELLQVCPDKSEVTQ